MQLLQSGGTPSSAWQIVWAYLTQPLFNAQRRFLMLNPWQFRRWLRMRHLECCWQQEVVQQLENCWNKPAFPPDIFTNSTR
jgi:hypothetical protein